MADDHGKLPFPAAFERRLAPLRAQAAAEGKTDVDLLREGIALCDAADNPDVLIIPSNKSGTPKK